MVNMGSHIQINEELTSSILICDDEDLFRRSIARILNNSGYSTISACNGSECIQAVRSNENLELIILDQEMPGLTINEIIKQIRQQKRDIPILVSSGYPNTDIKNWLEKPKVDFIQKPFKCQELLTRILELLEAN